MHCLWETPTGSLPGNHRQKKVWGAKILQSLRVFSSKIYCETSNIGSAESRPHALSKQSPHKNIIAGWVTWVSSCFTFPTEVFSWSRTFLQNVFLISWLGDWHITSCFHCFGMLHILICFPTNKRDDWKHIYYFNIILLFFFVCLMVWNQVNNPCIFTKSPLQKTGRKS